MHNAKGVTGGTCPRLPEVPPLADLSWSIQISADSSEHQSYPGNLRLTEFSKISLQGLCENVPDALSAENHRNNRFRRRSSSTFRVGQVGNGPTCTTCLASRRDSFSFFLISFVIDRACDMIFFS